MDSVNIDFISVFDQNAEGYFSFGWETVTKVENWRVTHRRIYCLSRTVSQIFICQT